MHTDIQIGETNMFHLCSKKENLDSNTVVGTIHPYDKKGKSSHKTFNTKETK